MKILLLITVCATNSERIKFQIANLEKHKDNLKNNGIIPIFVFGDIAYKEQIDYDSWNLDTEERYSNLYKKILKSLKKSLDTEYDYLIKIDDDTLVNWDKFGVSFLKDYDYIGRIQNFYTQNKVVLDIPMFNINKTINLYPQTFKENFKFATGDFYCLNKKTVEFLVEQEEFVYQHFKEEEYICEDQLIGFLLRNKEIKTNDLTFGDINIQLQHKLQITKDVLSIHPINTVYLKSILEKNTEDQIDYLIQNKFSNLMYRENLLSQLQTNIITEVFNFVNSKKLMGMG